MSAPVVFLGPSLPLQEAQRELDAVFLPPAAHGELYRACALRPRAIALIDGYFDRVPAVWHKEILWALKQGIAVFGGASMGALRAAELDSFGMIGVGSVYTNFRTGELEDDDEVAVCHATAEHGYRPLSEALVNIRATVKAALTASVIGRGAAVELCALAKAIHYSERHYGSLLRKARTEPFDPQELDAFESWLPTGKVNQKSLDALAVLRQTRSHLESGTAPASVRFEFSNTDAWREVQRREEALPSPVSASYGPLQRRALEDELIVAGQWGQARAAALARAVLADAGAFSGSPLAEAIHVTVEEFRLEHGLVSEAEFEAWISQQGFSDVELTEFFTHEARLRQAQARYELDLGVHLVNHLRAVGQYQSLLQRAEDKQRCVGNESHPDITQLGLSEAELWRWFFMVRLAAPLPKDLERDIPMNFGTSPARLRLTAIREYRYLHEQRGHSSSAPPVSDAGAVCHMPEA